MCIRDRGRLVDDAAQPHIVPGVSHDGHIGVDVLDLLAVVEALPAHDLMPVSYTHLYFSS